MSKRLPDHYSSLTESISTSRSAKRPKYLGQHPGVPYLTNNFFDGGADTTFENRGNDGVNITINIKKEEQEFINQHQFVWLFNVDESKQSLKSLAQINEFLADVQTNSSNKYYEEFNYGNFGPSDGKFLRSTHQKAWIVDKIVPIGTLAVQDAKTARAYTNRGAVSHTVTHSGASFVFDYWSYANHRLSSNSRLYFVLKKVHITDRYKFVTKISPGMYEHGVTKGLGNIIWQIVPKFTSNNKRISTDDYTFKHPITKEEELGYYWYIGKLHETQLVFSTGSTALRDEFTTARSTSALYNAEDNTALQCYLLRDNKCPLLMC